MQKLLIEMSLAGTGSSLSFSSPRLSMIVGTIFLTVLASDCGGDWLDEAGSGWALSLPIGKFTRKLNLRSRFLYGLTSCLSRMDVLALPLSAYRQPCWYLLGRTHFSARSLRFSGFSSSMPCN